MRARIVILPRIGPGSHIPGARAFTRQFRAGTYLDVILTGRDMVRKHTTGLKYFRWSVEYMSRRMRWEIVEAGNEETQAIAPVNYHAPCPLCPPGHSVGTDSRHNPKEET